jgi:Family of unknown function (DUF6335)
MAGKRKRSSRSKTKARPSPKSRRRAQPRRKAIEAVRRAPLEPEMPVGLDADALDVLADTQTLEEGEQSEESIDRKRGTILTGGDVDAAWDEVDVGEETVGGSTPTPDQDRVDDLGRAAGVTYSDTEPLRPEEKEMQRDEKRWELDPASSPDYPERQRELRAKRKSPTGSARARSRR